MAILISDKVVFRAKKVTGDKGIHYITIKGPVHQEDITVLSVYAPNNRTSKYMKQNLIKLKGEMENSTIIAEEFTVPCSVINRTGK